LKKFQSAGYNEYSKRDLVYQLLSWGYEKNHQNPENLIKDTGSIIIEPPSSCSRIEFKQESRRSDGQEEKTDVYAGGIFRHDCGQGSHGRHIRFT
jgi:hypothetical protein